MKKSAGVVCILISYVLFAYGSPFFGSQLGLLVCLSPNFSVPVFGFGVILGLLGAGLLYTGLVLFWPEEDSTPIEISKLLGSGLLFPGAAQAYAGRLWWAGLFAWFPFILMFISMGASIAVGFTAQFFPRAVNLTPAILRLTDIGKPSYFIYAALWIASLAESIWWFNGLPENPPKGWIPRGKGAVVGLGSFIFFWVFSLFMLSIATSIALKAGKHLKSAAASMAGHPVHTAPIETQSVQ